MSEVLCIGSTHHVARIGARERFAIVGAAKEQVVQSLMANPNILEVVPLMTCNRSELYIVTDNVEETVTLTYAALARHADIPADELLVVTNSWTGDSAVRHLMRVAAGLDSLVMGEVEIQGQVKAAMEEAHTAGWSGRVLHRMFEQALAAGKRVRTETSISSGNASISSAAAELLVAALDDPATAEVIVLGAGEMGGQAARALATRGVGTIRIINRNQVRAHHLAEQVGGTAHVFDDLVDLLPAATAIITATRAPHWLVSLEFAEQEAVATDLSLTVGVDLSVPRDIDPAFAERSGMQLYDIDDLESVVRETNATRSEAARAAQVMVDAATLDFAAWMRQSEVTPIIRELRNQAEALREREYERFLGKAGHLAVEDRKRVEVLTKSIVNKLLHEPMVNLRASTDAEVGCQTELIDSAATLFGLEIDDEQVPALP